jgi:hypothetical protein
MVMAIMAVQFMAMGLMAEMIVRTYFESRGKPPYLVSRTKNFTVPPEGVELAISAPALHAFRDAHVRSPAEPAAAAMH